MYIVGAKINIRPGLILRETRYKIQKLAIYVGLVQLKLITVWYSLDIRQKRQTQMEEHNLSVTESWESYGLKR